MLPQRAPAANIYKKPLGKLEVPHPNKDVMGKILPEFLTKFQAMLQMILTCNIQINSNKSISDVCFFPFFGGITDVADFSRQTSVCVCVCHNQSSNLGGNCRSSHDYTGVSYLGRVRSLFGSSRSLELSSYPQVSLGDPFQLRSISVAGVAR